MSTVTFDRVTKTFGSTVAVRELSFEAGDGEFLVIVGPSGCGKSTILRLVSGLEAPDSGRILIDGNDVDGRAPKDRGVAMVFQSYALYPHWTVFDNIAFPLRIRHHRKTEIDRRVREIAALLQLTEQLDRRPKALSGGQRQRVALGRAIAANPKILLFDEPLSNLDAPLRAEMRREIVTRQKALGTTSLYVTHDQTEALTMGDRVLVLDAGTVMGVGTPAELYENPPNRFVATFLGRPPINLFRGKVERHGEEWLVQPPGWSIAPVNPAILERLSGVEYDFAIRPEHVHVTGVDAGSRWRVTGQEFLGDRTYCTVSDGPLTMTGLAASPVSVADSDGAQVSVDTERIVVFDPADGRRLL